MAQNFGLQVRRAVVAHLKNEPVGSLVAGRVHSEQPRARPERPFIRYGETTFSSYDETGSSGSDGVVTIHVFTKSPGTDEAYTVANGVENALHERTLEIGNGALLRDMDWLDTQILRDTDEADSWHGIIRFNAVAMKAAPISIVIGNPGTPGEDLPPEVDDPIYDPGDLTLIFDNKLV